MEQNSSQDLDVMHLFSQFKKSVIGAIVLAFNALDFIIKKWWIILLLILIGAAAGYFTSFDSKQAQKASALLRINFDAVNYVYKEVELINEKIKERDSVFFTTMGLGTNSLEVRELVLTPVVNLKELGEKYEDTYRNVDGFIKNVEFDKSEIEVAKTFNSEYMYHTLDIALSSEANRKTVDKLVDYLNEDILLGQIRDTVIENMKRRITTNQEVVDQIDKMIETYTKNQSVNASTGPMFVVDKDFSLHTLLNKKTDLLIRNDNLRKDLIMSQDIVVITNKAPLVKVKLGFLGRKMISYPIIFVFAFLFLAWVRYAFKYLKKLAEINA
jgi:hypothetical protein|tara:strand:- start:3361 stop:4341 length:981 start_codon:yes stop_codon:yes gene_type:complete